MKYLIHRNLWAKIGLAIGLVILLIILVLGDGNILDYSNVFWLNVSILMFHQFEEFVFPGGFVCYFNNNIYNKNIVIRNKLNGTGAFNINVTIGWTSYILCAVLDSPSFLVVLLLINIVNGSLHAILALTQKSYNPGFITAFFVLIPVSVYGIFSITGHHLIANENWFPILVATLTGCASIPFTLFMTKE